MKSFLSKNKYNVLTLLAVLAIIALLAFCIVPKAVVFSERLTSVRSEVKIAESIGDMVASPDSLIDEYRKVSSQIDRYVNARATSSRILAYIHDTAQKKKVSLHDLSTGEIKRSSGKTEIPVSFRMNASFADMHEFVTELENGIFCIQLHDVNMNREESGRVDVSVQLSVLSKGVPNE